MENLYEKMKEAVLEGDEEIARELAQKALQEKLDLIRVMNEGFLKGITEAGQLYADGEYFLPELVCSAEAMNVALEVLDEELKKNTAGIINSTKIVLATVQGDVHDIGKAIVGAMLTAAGYEIHDLGADVSNDAVILAVRQIKPDILGLSALLTTTMEQQKNIMDLLVQEGLKDSVKVIVGGAPVSREWAEKIKADGYSDNAIDAVKLVKELMA
jgi:corrinoid protein of di/trimethylamine methyltransferase